MTGTRRLIWFGVIGGASTLLYAGLAWLLTVPLGWWPPLASAVAFTACAVGSFTGHRLLTFRSKAPVGSEIRRFSVTSGLGYGLATLVPWLLTGLLHLDPRIAIIAVCILCPVVNFVFLSFFVFRSPVPVSLDQAG